MIRTYRYRIKDSSAAPQLNKLARSCNFVWNFCNESQEHALRWNQRWPTGFDLNKLTAGCSKELGLHSQTVQAVCEQYETRRKQFKKRRLRWRGKRSPGWVPFKASGIKVIDDTVRYGWALFKTLLSYKAIARKVVYREVSERLSTQTCSGCGAIGGPKGREGLGIREWVCGECNAVHDRDVNAAMNILRLGHQSLALK